MYTFNSKAELYWLKLIAQKRGEGLRTREAYRLMEEGACPRTESPIN